MLVRVVPILKVIALIAVSLSTDEYKISSVEPCEVDEVQRVEIVQLIADSNDVREHHVEF